MAVLIVKTKMQEVEELACKIIGLDYDEVDADSDLINNKLMKELKVDLEVFQQIVNRLLPLIDVGHSATKRGVLYKGFADTNSQMWYVKTKVKP